MTTQPSDWAVELLPCPFCGGRAHLERTGHVACETGWPCAHTAYFNNGTPAEQNAAAIAAWNRRAPVARELDASGTTNSAQISSSLVVGDTERLDWIMRHVRGSELRRIGVHTNGGEARPAIDAAMGAVGAGGGDG